MRNVFEHYPQAENQLTHALFSTLHNDRRLLGSFIKDICRVKMPGKADEISMSVQQYPLGQRYTEQEIEARNIPDAWIFDDDGWALVFEAKITASLTQQQLEGHQRVAARLGFDQVRFFIVVADKTTANFDGWTQITWQEIYVWLRKQTKHDLGSEWATIAADYFEILEANMLESGRLDSSEITSFTGFFDAEDDYSYLLAKSKLKKALNELRKDKRLVEQLGMDPNASGRGAITGKAEERVWDFLTLKNPFNTNNFTKFLHLTMGIKSTSIEAMVTIPNGLATPPKNAIKSLGLDGFKEVCDAILSNMGDVIAEEPNAVPIMRGVQRRYPTQRSVPFLDALLEFDLRTAFENSDGPKQQEQWLAALFDAFANKKSNYQFQIGVEFTHSKCPTMWEPKALDLLTKSWLACKPLIEAAHVLEN